MEMIEDKPIYKLNDDALPLPIESSGAVDGSQVMQFIDINQFLNITCGADVKSEMIERDENHE